MRAETAPFVLAVRLSLDAPALAWFQTLIMKSGKGDFKYCSDRIANVPFFLSAARKHIFCLGDCYETDSRAYSTRLYGCPVASQRG